MLSILVFAGTTLEVSFRISKFPSHIHTYRIRIRSYADDTQLYIAPLFDDLMIHAADVTAVKQCLRVRVKFQFPDDKPESHHVTRTLSQRSLKAPCWPSSSQESPMCLSPYLQVLQCTLCNINKLE